MCVVRSGGCRRHKGNPRPTRSNAIFRKNWAISRLAPLGVGAPSGKSWICYWFLLKKKLEDISPFCGATNTLILDFWWHLPWVSKQGGFPHLCASSPVHNRFLRFTSGATPANCIEVSMATKPFLIHVPADVSAGIDRGSGESATGSDW